LLELRMHRLPKVRKLLKSGRSVLVNRQHLYRVIASCCSTLENSLVF
jgi:hypothetical protein